MKVSLGGSGTMVRGYENKVCGPIAFQRKEFKQNSVTAVKVRVSPPFISVPTSETALTD